ncbi:MAG: GNAT family N-acetyltransferase [Flavobacteriia bacterium]|nr:GNAT family N-acetyltransferase [Flavobacteriia bacterium]
MEIRSPKTEIEWNAYYALRYDVLRKPLNQPLGSERNEGDLIGLHFALYDTMKLMAIARLDEVDFSTCQVRFVAVSKEAQGKGYGKLIMAEVEKEGRAKGYTKMVLHARDYALEFYKKLDYSLIRESYKLFDVLQHYEMFKKL